MAMMDTNCRFYGFYSCWALQVDPVPTFARVQTLKSLQRSAIAFRFCAKYGSTIGKLPEEILVQILKEIYDPLYRERLKEAKLLVRRWEGKSSKGSEAVISETNDKDILWDRFHDRIIEMRNCIRVSRDPSFRSGDI